MLKKDIEELKNAIIDFYNITGIMIVIYDENFNQIFGYPSYNSPFCHLIRKSLELCEKCSECDRNAMIKCKQQKKLLIYECHMGLIEAMAPILSSDSIIGYLLIGQILPKDKEPHIYDKIESLPQNSCFSKKDLYDALTQMTPRPRETLESAAHIMEMCTCFISQNRFVFSMQNSLQREIEKYIHTNISNSDLSMKSICNHFLISRSTLYEVSKKAYGGGISDYIRFCRIEKAKELLLQKKMSIADISRACGFNEPNYFTKAFKNLTGVLPKDYSSTTKPKK